jgi:signal transduction histidine kinase
MTISNKLGLTYLVLAVISAVLVMRLGYHEFIAEPREFARMGLHEIHKDTWAELWAVAFFGSIPFMLAAGWWWMQLLLSPLTRLTRAVESLDEKHLGTQLPASGNGDEIDTLAQVFNRMSARLEESFRHLRTAGVSASHELKTPLTVMRGQLERALAEARREGVPPERLAWMESQIEEVDRLSAIVQSLMQIAANRSGDPAVLLRDPVDLGLLVAEAAEDAKVLGESSGIHVEATSGKGCTVVGDKNRLRQLLLILVDNGIGHNLPGGLLKIACRHAGEDVELELENCCGTRPSADPERLFDPFVRGEGASRSGGCGMGLAIARSLVELHGGSISLISTDDQVTVRCRFPGFSGSLRE